MSALHEYNFADTCEEVFVADGTVAMRCVGDTFVMFLQVYGKADIAHIAVEVVFGKSKS